MPAIFMKSRSPCHALLTVHLPTKAVYWMFPILLSFDLAFASCYQIVSIIPLFRQAGAFHLKIKITRSYFVMPHPLILIVV